MSFINSNKPLYITFLLKSGKLNIPLEKIVFFKADGTYTKVFLINKKSILLSKPIGIIEKQIGSNYFVSISIMYPFPRAGFNQC